jgi:hypothetical protein
MDARDKLIEFFQEVADNAQFDADMRWHNHPEYAKEVFNEALYQYEESIAKRLLEAQAQLQVGLGLARMELAQLPKDGIQALNLGHGEIRLSKGLHEVWKIMADLGTVMISEDDLMRRATELEARQDASESHSSETSESE